MKLHCEQIGAGQPVLVLLHGLSANGAVWFPLAEKLRFQGKILIPDLRGHGRSPHAKHYGYGQHAADVAELLSPQDSIFIVGHSMGGAVGMTLASGWFGVEVKAIVAFSTKTDFSREELGKLATLARAPVRWLETRALAAERFLRVTGLEGLLGADAPAVAAGITELQGRYRLSADPATVTAAGPPFEQIVAAARSKITLACGSNDPMVKISELRQLAKDAVELPGLGHNLHVEDPQALLRLMGSTLFETSP